jgi:hypothetical protein
MPVAPEVSHKHAAATPSMEEASATAESDATSPIDYSPSARRPIPLVAGEEPLPEDRGSFYSRRSANLPRIGESVGKDTLTAMRSMRQVIAQTD